jgi:hypothetical protein
VSFVVNGFRFLLLPIADLHALKRCQSIGISSVGINKEEVHLDKRNLAREFCLKFTSLRNYQLNKSVKSVFIRGEVLRSFGLGKISGPEWQRRAFAKELKLRHRDAHAGHVDPAKLQTVPDFNHNAPIHDSVQQVALAGKIRAYKHSNSRQIFQAF